ncbi:hypothetical protein POM88_038741 [Heracleum sosnowskyi]|uniref:Cytochrome P450 n=1 Tax=Heracleum sosnowskyi TaxID=360622 RepID=A0AAD8M5S7_9APIA|nr:hypothetical protein POM88_038741 [Heracleum sosnowskyi]
MFLYKFVFERIKDVFYSCKVEKVANELDDLLEGVVTDHIIALESNVAVNQDFVSILLENWKQKRENGFSIDKDCIKAVTFDMLAGGTDTTSTTLEWTMAMLMKNPDIMCKLQKEVRNISRGKSRITEDDLDKMQYLKAVIKESLRINIPVPLIARETREDVKEGLPGHPVWHAVNELALANMVNMFDFALPDAETTDDLDMAGAVGLSVGKKSPLLVVANPQF